MNQMLTNAQANAVLGMIRYINVGGEFDARMGIETNTVRVTYNRRTVIIEASIEEERHESVKDFAAAYGLEY